MAWQTIDQQYGQQNNRNDRSNYLQDIIAGLSIANNNDPATLAGYGIGRFLSNYVNRGLERRQQEKNQGAYDEWMRGRQGIKGEELLPELQGTPIVNPNTQPQKYSFDPSQIAEEINQQNASGDRPNYLERALEGSAFSAGGKPFFEMPQGNAQPQAETAPSMQEAARSIAAEIASRPTTPRFDMTSDEVYQQAYEIARRNGSTEDQARKFAQQRAGLYQSQRVQSLSDQFLNGGVNPDGTINNQGVATLAQLAQENPQQVKMLGNMYQTPQGATEYAQDIAKSMLGYNMSLRNSKEMADVNFNNSQKAADAQAERQRAARIESAQNAADAAIMQAYLEAIGQNVPQEKALEYAQQQGEIAFLSAMSGGRGYIGGRNSGPASGGRSSGGAAQNGGSGQMSAKNMKDLIGVYQTQKEIADNYVLNFEEKYKNKPKEMESDPNYKQYQNMKKESARLEKLIMDVGKTDDTFTANTPAEAIEQIRTKHPEWSPDYIQWIVQNMPGFKDFYQYGNNGESNGIQIIPQSNYTDEEREYLER